MALVLTVVPYRAFFPPRNGGHLRSFYLLRELAGQHEVHAIILQPEADLRRPKDGYRFPPSVHTYGPAQTKPPHTVFDWLPGRLGPALHYRYLTRSPRGPANSILLETHHLLHRILSEYSIDVVLLTTLSSLCAASLVRRLSPGTVCILNTENVEHRLLTQVSEQDMDKRKGQKAFRKSYQQTLWYESHLARFVHAFFACSDNDLELLRSLNRGELEGFVVPNGVDTGTRPFDNSPEKSKSRELLFCGSLAHLPNREGLLWFHQEVWPRLVVRRPDLRLVIIGRGAETSDLGTLRCDPAVELVGEVADVVPHYRRAGIAVVPLWMGSGTRLKILEAMSLGNPIVSTTLGAQGLGAADGEHLLLADDPVQFANAIEYLLSDEKGFERTRRHARVFVQKHDWHVIGQTMNQAIEAVLVTRQRGE